MERDNSSLNIENKIYFAAGIEGLRKSLRESGKKMVFTNGCFDIIHPGHIMLLIKAKELGNFLMVGLNSDASVRRLKGTGRPIMPVEARQLLLCSMVMVDGVFVFGEDTPREAIELLRPDIYIKGTGYSIEQMKEIDQVTDYGGEVVLTESLSDFSTTAIMERIRSTPADLL